MVNQTQTALTSVQGQLNDVQAELSRIHSKSEARTQSALDTLDGMINAAFRIRQQLWSGGQPNFHLTMRSQYWIKKDFSANVRTEYEIKAVDGPIHFWEYVFGEESEASPVEYLLDINFRIIDDHGHEVVYLLSGNGARSKRVVLYFHPFIDPSVGDSRRFVISYSWPGYFLHLKERKQEALLFPITAKLLELMECEVFMEPGTSYILKSEEYGSSQGQPHLEEVTSAAQQGMSERWKGWKYSVRKAPQGEYGILLRLQNP